MPEFNVWVDNDEEWPVDSIPEPKAVFEAPDAYGAACCASASGEFDYDFETGREVKLIVNRVGTDEYAIITMEARVEYYVSDEDIITLKYLRGAAPSANVSTSGFGKCNCGSEGRGPCSMLCASKGK